MLDFNHGSGLKLDAPSISDAVNAEIDRGLIERNNQEELRDYLGASVLGEPCGRKLQYEALAIIAKRRKQFTGLSLRIFAMGHKFEDLAAEWLRLAGFDLRTADANGKQFGFGTLGGKVGGHIDGVILGGRVARLKYPIGWEHKALKDVYWQKIKKQGVKNAHPIYHGQMQLYMGYMDLPRFLFSCTNKNTAEMHHEVVEFDAAVAQRLSDRSVEVFRAIDGGFLLDRIASNSDFYLCRLCEHQRECWADGR